MITYTTLFTVEEQNAAPWTFTGRLIGQANCCGAGFSSTVEIYLTDDEGFVGRIYFNANAAPQRQDELRAFGRAEDLFDWLWARGGFANRAIFDAIAEAARKSPAIRDQMMALILRCRDKS
jgi:hypothetical protein